MTAYNQPYGAAANASYVNGNPSTGTQGSIPPAAAMENPQREIINVITAASLTPTNADLTQLLQAIRKLIGKDPANSTQNAPKLVGIMADATPLGTSCPTSTNTQISFGNVLQNNLGTSTWTGNNLLTVGSGEAGLWMIYGSCYWPSPAGGYFASSAIYVNSTETVYQGMSAGNTGDAQVATASGLVKLSAGNTVKIMGYQQSGGSLTTQASNRTRFQAFLISAY